MSKIFLISFLLLLLSCVQSESGDLEDGDHFQGDIRLSPEQEEMFLNKSGTFSSGIRTGLIDENYRWPMNDDGFVNVPFQLSDTYGDKLL